MPSALDETISVKRLRLPKKLERQLSTTNAIENLMGSVRRLSRRVKHWRGGKMILRWTVTAVADAATRFRKITGARDGIAALMRALERQLGGRRVFYVGGRPSSTPAITTNIRMAPCSRAL